MRKLLILLGCVSIGFACPLNLQGQGKGKGNGGNSHQQGNNGNGGGNANSATVKTLQKQISADSGTPAENFQLYAESLAKILGQHDQEALARIFQENVVMLPDIQ